MLEQVDLACHRDGSRYLQDATEMTHPLRPVISSEHREECADDNNDPRER